MNHLELPLIGLIRDRTDVRTILTMVRGLNRSRTVSAWEGRTTIVAVSLGTQA